jgi:hypothetical protein
VSTYPGSLPCPWCASRGQAAQASRSHANSQTVIYDCRCGFRFRASRAFLDAAANGTHRPRPGGGPPRKDPDRVYLDAVLSSAEAAAEAAEVLRQGGAEVGTDHAGRLYTSRRDPRVLAWLAYLDSERQASVARYGY